MRWSTLRTSMTSLFVLLALLAFLPACGDQSTDENLDGDSPDGWTLTFTYGGEDYEVNVSELEKTTYDELEVVPLLAAFEASGIDKSLDALTFDFAGGDGYTPASSSNCIDIIPISGEAISGGYLVLEDERLLWAVELDFPSCLSVKQLAKVIVTDAPDPNGWSLSVKIDGAKTIIDVLALTAEAIDGTQGVWLTDVLAEAGLTDLTDYVADFEAADGFKPSDSDNCVDAVPVSYESLPYAWLALDEKRLMWTDDVDMPGCLSLSDLAIVTLTYQDPNAPELEWPIKVVYGENETTVEATTIAMENFDGTQGRSVVALLAEAGYSDLSGLSADFEASDGWKPNSSDDCAAVLPMSGSDLQYFYLTDEELRLNWTDDVDYPGCLGVRGLATIYLTDSE